MCRFRARVWLAATVFILVAILTLPSVALAYSPNPLSAGYTGQCTWWVWNRWPQANGALPSARTAYLWLGDAQAAHWSTGPSPAVGAVAVWDNTYGIWIPELGSKSGHVAYVERLNADGSFHVSEYNWATPLGYGERDVWDNDHINFIYPPGGSSSSLSDGTFVQVSGSPAVYRIAGGAPLYVSNWAAVGGPQPCVTISQSQFDSLRPYPADGTFVASSGDGRVYRIAGGAPIYVSDWAAVGGPQPCVGIDKWAVDNIADPHAHLRAYPADGTFVASSGDGRVYRIAGGAPIYVSDWAAVGGPQPCVGIDKWAVDNIADPHAHLRAYPADGTFLNTSTGGVYRVAGGAPLFVSNWSLFGGIQPYVTVDQWNLDNISNPVAHLRAAPADGTTVEGLPSHMCWSFAVGRRSTAVLSAATVQVDDLALASFPSADTTPPTTGVSGIPASWSSSNVTFTLSAVDNVGGSGVDRTYYRLGSGSDTVYAAPVAVSSEGTTKVTYWSVDKSSPANTETVKTTTVLIDKTAPVTSSDAVASYVGTATITLSAADPLSGVRETQYSLDGGAQSPGTRLVVTMPGSHTLTFASTDNAGNVESVRAVTFNVTAVPGDTDAPVTNIILGVPASWSTSPVSLTLAAANAVRTYYRIGAGASQLYTVPVKISVEGTTTFSYWSVGDDGSTEAVRTATIRIDATAPVSSASVASTYYGTASIPITGADGCSGLARTEYRIDGGAWAAGSAVSVSVPGSHDLQYR